MIFAAATPTQRRWWRLACLLLGMATLLLIGYEVHGCYRRWRTSERLRMIDGLIERHAAAVGLPADLVRCVVRAESSGDPEAVSDKNAKGLMQITPPAETDMLVALGIRKGNLFDPDYNLRIGTAYLARLHRRFEGDLPLVLASYHMGQTKVARLVRAHPELSSRELVDRFAGPQTRAYVRRIIVDYQLARAVAEQRRREAREDDAEGAGSGP